jgi:hypothetical protein
MKILLDKD